MVHGNRIIEVNGSGVSARADGRIMDHGDGILMPALVNTHTHICLSDHARPHAVKGFIPWVQALITERNHQSPEKAAKTVQDGVKALKNTGTGLVGEFGPHVPVAMALKALRMHATVWLECLGNDRDLPKLPENTPTIHHAYGRAPDLGTPAHHTGQSDASGHGLFQGQQPGVGEPASGGDRGIGLIRGSCFFLPYRCQAS